MSFKAIKIENNLVRTFLVSSKSDFDEHKLPTNTTIGTNGLDKKFDNERVAIGSKAICVEDWSRWILSPENEWIKMPNKITSGSSGSGGSGSGSGSGESVDNIITDGDIDDIIGSLG